MGAPGILIVSASTGTGHTRAAEAVQQALSRQATSSSLAVEHVDLLELAPRWVRSAYGGGYELIATRTPWLWREIYRRTDAPESDLARWGPLAQRILFREFRRLLLSRPWSVCLSTHFLPGQLAAGGAGVPPFAMVVTDLTLHRFWAQPRVRRYFVGSEPLERDLRARVPGARIDATGIPVSPRFGEAPGRAEARRSLGLDPDGPVVLVMGGGLGIGVDATAEAVAEAAVPGLEQLVICGRNQAASARLRAHPRAGEALHVHDYVHDVPRFIAAADLVVTKPGGLTTSEVVAMGRPLLLTRAIPGQEEGNTRVLCEAGAALAAPDPAAVRRQVEVAFAGGELLARLRAAATRLGRPHAAHAIAEAVRGEFLVREAA